MFIPITANFHLNQVPAEERVPPDISLIEQHDGITYTYYVLRFSGGDMTLFMDHEQVCELRAVLSEFLDRPACPNCGSDTGEPRAYQGHIDPDTGYDDSGEGCSECIPEVRR